MRECLLLWEHVPRNFPNFSRDVHAIFDVRGITETLPAEPPARARSARARPKAIVRACSLESRAALATLALLPFVVLEIVFSLFLLLSLLSPCLQCLHAL